MEEQMKLIVEMLKDRIKYNLQIIRKNEEIIRSILSEPVSNERSKLLKENFSINRKLLEENNDSLALEVQIINYLGKFHDVLKQKNIKTNNETNNFESESFHNESKSEQLIENEGINLFNLTLSGDIPYNIEHPKFYDEGFFQSLFERFKLTENYEMCSYLLKVKGIKSHS